MLIARVAHARTKLDFTVKRVVYFTVTQRNLEITTRRSFINAFESECYFFFFVNSIVHLDFCLIIKRMLSYVLQLCIVCFTVLCVRCDTSGSSYEEETVPESYEDTKRSLYDDDSALEATHLNDGDTKDLRQHAERFTVPANGVPDGQTPGTNRPYFMHPQDLQQRLRPQSSQSQQPQQAQPQPQPQQQKQPQQKMHQMQQAAAAIQHSHHYHPPIRAPVLPDRLSYDHPSSADGNAGDVSGYNEQSDGFYQPSGGGGGGGRGGETISLDSTGFTDFVPSVGFQPVMPPLPSAPSSPYIASHHRQLPSYDGGSSGQLSFDPTGFGHESPSSAGYNVGAGGSSSGYSTGAAVGTGYDYPTSQAHQAPIIHKSIYVHVAPPDDEPPRKQRVIMPNVPPKKNYQIVFIKAPTAPPPTAPIIPPPPQHSDKTLIYVLHPKPEEAPPIHIPPPPVTQPLKPEVYFIKYKNREEPQGGGGGGGDYGAGAHGGVGGVLPSPGEEFGGGGGGDNSGYPHRRYGRGDQSPVPMESSYESSPTPAADGGTATTAAGAATDEDDDDNDDGDAMAMAPEQRELIEATVAATAAAADETAEEQQGPYSTEYNDASVDSTNMNEMHVLSTVTPKGKNGH